MEGFPFLEISPHFETGAIGKGSVWSERLRQGMQSECPNESERLS